MKRVTLFVASCILLLFTQCRKVECGFGEGIVGEWKLIEEMMDPGDGSGTFQSVVSNKQISFFSNGSFEANGEMCGMSSQSTTTHTGTYDTSSETFLPDNCNNSTPLSFRYSVTGNTLILSYPCTCGCQQKYKRI